MQNNRNYLSISIIIALAYWVFDSLLYWGINNHEALFFFPPDLYLFWTKTVIFLLITGFGAYLQYSTRKIHFLQNEKEFISSTSASESRKILKEFLHDIRYYESEEEIVHGFDGNCLGRMENALKKAESSLIKLDNLH